MATPIVTYKAGLDIGSTTAKLVVVDGEGRVMFSAYQRHNTKVYEIIGLFLTKAVAKLGKCNIDILITGSAGMGISEKSGIPFIQEVVATEEVVRKHYPEIRTLIDIGGEDSKMIFFNKSRLPDIRMNGNCAGGTGAFIDQIATLLNITPQDLNELAKDYTTIYPIASRCGVFAKTDVQNLISRKVPRKDIAASVFHAVAVQCMNTLARGFDITPKILLCGGPFTFLSELSTLFLKAINADISDCIVPDHPELLPALGAALADRKHPCIVSIDALQEKLVASRKVSLTKNHRLSPLFTDRNDYREWTENHSYIEIPWETMDQYKHQECFLGIDSGSTTTKITVTGLENQILFSRYSNNHGNPVNTVIEGLHAFHKEVQAKNPGLTIAKSTVTGYGEELIKSALGMDNGVVETIAHYTAAKHVSPHVSFVLDIGGQDMKAIFIEDGIINRIELNEACSSGCGSFIETFGNSLGYEVSEFADIACHAEAPCDLGTRCTVFMNSKVKQSLRENATVEEISAGLAYSVIKNCLFKVLKLTNMDDLGGHIVLQGGTFKNPSIVRAMEILSGKDIKCSNIPELMGAYGASLIACQDYKKDQRASTFIGLENLSSAKKYKTRQVLCKGCENRCSVTRFTFENGSSFFSGNKCEKFFNNKGEAIEQGFNLFEYKKELLFNQRSPELVNPRFRIGIPRALSIYEGFPFWKAMFHACNIEVVLSAQSTMKLYEKGMGSVMSDSICFPAKLTHGHMIDLVEKQVDRLFYPLVFFEENEFEQALRSFNCPIVSSYGEVINSAINPQRKLGIPLDKPVINFSDDLLLRRSCEAYLRQFDIPKSTISQAINAGLKAQQEFKQNLRSKTSDLIQKVKEQNRLLIVLAGRPYHTDPLINHKTPEILTSLGADVITEDSLPIEENDHLGEVQLLTQWAYPNRIYHAAQWVSHQPDNIQLIQFNSFGCGPDALATDETNAILKKGHKNYTLIKIDEITSTGSVRLRLRSMIESLKIRKPNKNLPIAERSNTPPFEFKDKERTILVNHFSDSYSSLIPSIFKLTGYNVEILPKSDKTSVEYGLQYSNNDICFPATIVIGDIIRAVKSGKYDHNKIAIGITQTGGQCRASSYLSLIRKALVSAGFNDIPVVSVTLSAGLNNQPGFEINWLKVTRILLLGTLYADCLAKMYYATVVREKSKGSAKLLQKKYLDLADVAVRSRDHDRLLKHLKDAVEEFNKIETHDREYPKIGIVGEIYVKYNSFGHQGIVDWLIEQGIEVVVPPIIDFFLQDFINSRVNRKEHLRKKQLSDFFAKGLNFYLQKNKKTVEKIFSNFRFFRPFHNLKSVSQKAAQILNLTNQFGEGWLISAEISAFAEEGINNVVSLQPFGCIANHVISKGVEARIKELFPEMNLLFLDFEAGTSEVNILNRLYFMIKSVSNKQGVA